MLGDNFEDEDPSKFMDVVLEDEPGNEQEDNSREQKEDIQQNLKWKSFVKRWQVDVNQMLDKMIFCCGSCGSILINDEDKHDSIPLARVSRNDPIPTKPSRPKTRILSGNR
mmetsp:Transcript_6035/g.9218  ORF Transcript_6035/g.9218 Transcript_6035/m.9218 type:complete len:111 (+) Transcript_6035:104-436(+)